MAGCKLNYAAFLNALKFLGGQHCVRLRFGFILGVIHHEFLPADEIHSCPAATLMDLINWFGWRPPEREQSNNSFLVVSANQLSPCYFATSSAGYVSGHARAFVPYVESRTQPGNWWQDIHSDVVSLYFDGRRLETVEWWGSWQERHVMGGASLPRATLGPETGCPSTGWLSL